MWDCVQKISHLLANFDSIVALQITFLNRQTADEGDDGDAYGFELLPPHLCQDGRCQVYMQHAGRMRLELALIANNSELLDNYSNDTEETQWCTYRQGKFFSHILSRS